MPFPFPPGEAKAPSPLQWQGPSPLPRRSIASCPAGGQKPPASARPATGGRWPLLLPDLPVYRAPSRAGGGNAVRFLFPPERAFSRMPGHSGRGHRPCHSAAPGLGPAGGPKPPASARPATGGRWPLLLPDLLVYRGPSHAGGETRVAFPRPAPGGVICPRIGKTVPSVHAAGVPLPHPVNVPEGRESEGPAGPWPGPVAAGRTPAGKGGLHGRRRGDRRTNPRGRGREFALCKAQAGRAAARAQSRPAPAPSGRILSTPLSRPAGTQ